MIILHFNYVNITYNFEEVCKRLFKDFIFIIYNLQKTFVSLDLNYLGQRYVLMNQHLLLHLVKSVYDHGPLWSSSLFVFEDWNGDIGNYFHGTQNIANQVRS